MSMSVSLSCLSFRPEILLLRMLLDLELEDWMKRFRSKVQATLIPVETSPEGNRTLGLLKWSLRKWQIEIAPIWLIRAFGLNLHARTPNKKSMHFSKTLYRL